MKKVTVSSTLSSVKQIAAISAGLAAGKLTADQAVSRLHPIYGPLAGTIVMGILAVQMKNPYAKSIFAGIGAVHLITVVKNATAGKTGLLSVVNSYTPSVSGLKGLGNADINIDRFLGNAGSSMPALEMSYADDYATPVDSYLS